MVARLTDDRKEVSDHATAIAPDKGPDDEEVLCSRSHDAAILENTEQPWAGSRHSGPNWSLSFTVKPSIRATFSSFMNANWSEPSLLGPQICRPACRTAISTTCWLGPDHDRARLTRTLRFRSVLAGHVSSFAPDGVAMGARYFSSGRRRAVYKAQTPLPVQARQSTKEWAQAIRSALFKPVEKRDILHVWSKTDKIASHLFPLLASQIRLI